MYIVRPKFSVTKVSGKGQNKGMGSKVEDLSKVN
jgi:hypothetical protein